MDLVLFGPYNLSGQKCALSRMTEHSLPTHLLQREKVARQDGTVLVSDSYNEKMIAASGRLKRPSGHVPTFREIEDEFDNSMSKINRRLRVARTVTSIALADSATNWAAADDATNITVNTSMYQVSSQSLSFDIDWDASANDYATISNASLTAVDLSAVESTGSVEFWIYIPSVAEVASIDFRWGSDAGNYWNQDAITANYEGNALENGWNYISVYWPTASSNGAPDSSAIDYLYIRLNYSTLQRNMTGVLLNGFQWIDDEDTVNYLASVESVNKPEEHYNVDFIPIDINFLCTEGTAYGTHEITALDRDTMGSVSNIEVINFDGSYDPQPKIIYDVDVKGGLASLNIENVTTKESMTIATIFTAGDRVIVDTKTLDCTLNGIDVEYEGVFPRFVVGRNKIITTLSGVIDTQSQTTANNYKYQAPGTGQAYWLAQTFTAGANGTLTSVQLYGYGNTGQNCSAYLYTNNAGAPGTFLKKVTISLGPVGWQEWKGWATNLTNGSVYWLIWLSDIEGFANTAYLHGGYNASGGYASGSMYDLLATKSSYPPLVGWTNYAGYDMAFSATVSQALSTDVDWEVTYKKRFL